MQFTLSSSGDTEITVRDISGKILDTGYSGYMEQGRHILQFPAEYSSGTYLINIFQNGHSFLSGKMVVE